MINLWPLWRVIKPPLLVLDKSAGYIYTTFKGRPEFVSISALLGRAGGHSSSNEIVEEVCKVLDEIDQSSDSHCEDAARKESK